MATTILPRSGLSRGLALASGAGASVTLPAALTQGLATHSQAKMRARVGPSPALSLGLAVPPTLTEVAPDWPWACATGLETDLEWRCQGQPLVLRPQPGTGRGYSLEYVSEAPPLSARVGAGPGSAFRITAGTPEGAGYNAFGNLGDGTTTNQSVPVAPSGLGAKTVVQIAAGVYATYFVCSDGTVYVSGRNYDGCLGLGSSDFTLVHTTPVLIPLLSDVKAVSASWEGVSISPTQHTVYALALTNAGHVYAWGGGTYGELGTGSHGDYHENAPILVMGSVARIAAGQGFGHSLFLMDDGTVMACGYGANGELGQGEGPGVPPDYDTPQVVAGLTDIIRIGTGVSLSFALASDGTLYGWGDGDADCFGSAYVGSGPQTTPVTVVASGVADFRCGGDWLLLWMEDGTVQGMADNGDGQFGAGNGSSWYMDPTPITLPGGMTVEDIATAQFESYIAFTDGDILAQGGDYYGESGIGTL